jgi:DNA mismatch endonuclease, patch repair protein
MPRRQPASAEHYKTDALTTLRMSAVRPRDTRPEKLVRSLLHRLGFRYRLNCHDLPGRPDVVFRGRRKVIFVHGCYWHRHPHCPRTTTPARNARLWREKFRNTVRRDAQHLRALAADGWAVLVVWECETRDVAALARRLESFLRG